MNGAMQTIWHQAYERALQTITSLRNHCDFKYERDSKNAKEVKILNAVRPTIKEYVPGTPIERESISATDQTIQINQYRYFDISLDDVVKAQSVPGAMEATAKEGAIALSEEGDKYVASVIKAGVEADTNPLGSISAITLTKLNVIDHVEAGFEYLYSKNNKVSDSYWLEISPKFFRFLRPAVTELLTNNVEMAKKGIVAKYGNANVTIENLLPTGKSSSDLSADDVCYNVLRTDHAVAFIEQIDKVEAYRPQDAFEDALKGLYVFGAKIVRPDEIVVLKTNI